MELWLTTLGLYSIISVYEKGKEKVYETSRASDCDPIMTTKTTAEIFFLENDILCHRNIYKILFN